MRISSAGLGLFAVTILGASSARAAGGDYLYRAEMIQAAPGKIVELIDLLKMRSAASVAGGDEAPLWMRHSQGDHWDLLLLHPMKSYAEYYRTERIERRAKAQADAAGLGSRIQRDIAWQEDLFVYGPPIESIRAAFANVGLYHVEIIRALPGQQADLVKEREMESAFNRNLGRPELLIFVRDQGAAWDLFSIDCYRDIKHYAETADIPAEKQLAAARAAGYASPDEIGPKFRTVIAAHHDTLAVAVGPPPAK